MGAGVQHAVRNVAGLQHFRKHFGLLDRGGADEHRLAAAPRLVDRVDDGLVFLARRAIDLVVLVEAGHPHIGRNVEDIEAVDVHELLGLGQRRAGHAGELGIEAEVVLECDRGERHVLRLDRHVLLGFQRLVQAFRIAAARHHAAGELVDDDHLVILDDVILVALEKLVGTQRLLHVVHDGDVLGVIEIRAAQEACTTQHLFQVFVALFGQRHRALLLVEIVVFRGQCGYVLVHRIVEIRLVVDGARDDERGAGLVDEDRVDFVDDREIVSALHHLLEMVLHVVAQVVESELVVGGIGHVGGIGRAAFLVGQAMDDGARGEAEEAVDLAHPSGVALGEIVVHRHHVNALAGERVEIDGKGGDQGLAFAGLHFGNATLVQHHAADQLHIEVALAERTLGGLAHRGESRNQQVVQLLALSKLFPEHGGAGLERIVGEGCEFGFERVDRLHPAAVLGDLPLVARAENLSGDAAQSEH